jgi:restriction system protein
MEAQYGVLLTKHQDLVQKFLDITERKVSIVDDYGDENWGVLPEEIHRCLVKIAQREQSIDISKVKVKPDAPSVAKPLDGKEYRDQGARYLAARLQSKFAAHHKARKSLESTVGDFRELTGVEFETYLANLLRTGGFEVSGTPATGDQGADLIARKGSRTIAIQAKGYKQPVGNSAVQEVVAALRFYKADEGWVITNSVFTTSARELAHANKIRLIDGNDLKSFSTGLAERTALAPTQRTVRFIDL